MRSEVGFYQAQLSLRIECNVKIASLHSDQNSTNVFHPCTRNWWFFLIFSPEFGFQFHWMNKWSLWWTLHWFGNFFVYQEMTMNAGQARKIMIASIFINVKISYSNKVDNLVHEGDAQWKMHLKCHIKCIMKYIFNMFSQCIFSVFSNVYHFYLLSYHHH